MPFDPAQPATGSPLASQIIRNQLNALNELIQTTLPGPPGPVGPPGAEGPPGPVGEVTPGQLNDGVAQAILEARVNSSANSDGVALLSMAIGDPPTPGEVQALVDKLNELITALRRGV